MPTPGAASIRDRAVASTEYACEFIDRSGCSRSRAPALRNSFEREDERSERSERSDDRAFCTLSRIESFSFLKALLALFAPYAVPFAPLKDRSTFIALLPDFALFITSAANIAVPRGCDERVSFRSARTIDSDCVSPLFHVGCCGVPIGPFPIIDDDPPAVNFCPVLNASVVNAAREKIERIIIFDIV